jgi:hypothetical protein
MPSVRETDAKPRAIPCLRCGGRRKSCDDLYHLVVPANWSFDDVRAWGERGSTIALLHACGVRVDRVCVGCQTKESPR